MSATKRLDTKAHTKLTNQSLVFESFGENEKLTIAEITQRVNEKLQPHEKLSDQTVRRAVKSLCTSGLIKTFGKANNAVTYGKLSASWAAQPDDESEKLIPYAGELMTVEDYVTLMVSPDAEPLKLKMKNQLVSPEVENRIRRRFASVVLTAGIPGMQEHLKSQSQALHTILAEAEFLVSILNTFLDSAVWYEQYRDRIAREVRKLKEKNPELYQLTVDYIRSQ